MRSSTRTANQAGFSILEIMLTFTLISITAAWATPRYSDLSQTFSRMNVRSNLIQDLKRAQAESLTKGCRGIFEIDPNGESYSFGCDFLTYDTSNPPAADSISFTRTFPEGVTIVADSEVIFNSRGQSVDMFGVISNVGISLYRVSGSGSQAFVTGTLLGTGLYAIEL